MLNNNSICDFRCGTWCVLVTQSCLTLCDPMDCSSPGYSVHGILQARILEWVDFTPPRDLPYPGIEPRSPALQAGSLHCEPPGGISQKRTLKLSVNMLCFKEM